MKKINTPSPLFWLVLLTFFLSFSKITHGAEQKYKHYTNVRYGFSVSYPKDVLIPQGESTNGDGQEFLSKDGKSKMVVYGGNTATCLRAGRENKSVS